MEGKILFRVVHPCSSSGNTGELSKWTKFQLFTTAILLLSAVFSLCCAQLASSKMSISGVPAAMGRSDVVSVMILRSDLTSDSRCSTVFITFSSIISKRSCIVSCSWHQLPKLPGNRLVGSAAAGRNSHSSINRSFLVITFTFLTPEAVFGLLQEHSLLNRACVVLGGKNSVKYRYTQLLWTFPDDVQIVKFVWNKLFSSYCYFVCLFHTTCFFSLRRAGFWLTLAQRSLYKYKT